ncbi:hypothetical protein AUJ84_01680 [Candidatus Pacearchaeota archaeon CG1_02_32_132]|nr:MAG: hypothetical protein AUJ84_01680 [Candidatus Pacearchaeota archaeon CG1_02_32_132]
MDDAESYIVSYVSQNYFDEHIELLRSQTNSNIDKSGAKYRVVYNYGFNIKGDYTRIFIEFEMWLDESGNVIGYDGPLKPYNFLISRMEAKRIANDAGMTKVDSQNIIFGLGFRTDKGEINERYVWYLSSEETVKGEPEVIYLDLDTGDVIGILTKIEGVVVND